MSWITLPDPHPGRCLNVRPSKNRHGTMLRCLDNEGTEHVCSFEESVPLKVGADAWAAFQSSSSGPKPWVKP